MRNVSVTRIAAFVCASRFAEKTYSPVNRASPACNTNCSGMNLVPPKFEPS
jgi:hypothetical protein